MASPSVFRPVVRSFKQRFSKEAAAFVRSGGHAVVWENPKRARIVFQEPANDDDLNAWAVFDMGKSSWQVHHAGTFEGLASTLVPRDCLWIVKRRAERDSVHRGSRRKVSFDCTTCAACCRDNEVILDAKDVERFIAGGRPDLARPPLAKRRPDGKTVLTLLGDKRCRQLGADNRCGIYELRPHACSEFPMGSECCLYAREEELETYDGLAPDA
jgi:Fe-S-cluster containining protein